MVNEEIDVDCVGKRPLDGAVHRGVTREGGGGLPRLRLAMTRGGREGMMLG